MRGAPAAPAPFGVPLYPIVDAGAFGDGDPGPMLSALGAAGVRLAQLRAKEMPSRDFLSWVRAGVAGGREAGVSVIVNDRVEIALLADAAGAHLGQEDLSCRAAREILGERAVLGLSTHDEDQVRAADSEPCDYIAVGPVFGTATKRDAEPVVGLPGVAAARRATARPLVAIGGIGPGRMRAVLEAGADAAAVISALAGRSPGRVAETARSLLAAAAA